MQRFLYLIFFLVSVSAVQAQDTDDVTWYDYDFTLDGNVIVADYEAKFKAGVGAVKGDDPYISAKAAIDVKIRPASVLRSCAKKMVETVEHGIKLKKIAKKIRKDTRRARKMLRRAFT